ncbi:thiamine-phosphate kinase [Sphingosinicella rhizophila]|uniref:Thiamine-monophosphate kinase n=1 Tax=Sphingosinicella rhizophila TaxID=3050082 RepID=A0ABU3Q8K0_9SPHN|nr:thiamine-phosphate kinase [Sphingosinicella sp. GR2756]MDT9599733.1 thiamine-phosphate kinase [Sphingosinicella sp. GR2756]
MTEFDFIATLRGFATDPAARGLADDAAVLNIGGTNIVLTHDMIVENVHFLPADPPGDIAWKLLAVNLSDLAAKGARPIGALLGYSLGDDQWDRAFAEGMGEALAAFAIPLLGGDTVATAADSPRTLGLTAIGQALDGAPSRADARDGDHLWVTGSIGDAGAGLKILRGELAFSQALVDRYRNPRPRLEAGQALAPLVSAMMDVSDGLLIDAQRMAAASRVAARIDLSAIPRSDDLLQACGDSRDDRIAAACAGDDYELLFAADPGRATALLDLSDRLCLAISRIGEMTAGSGLILTDGAEEVPLPDRLGWEHVRPRHGDLRTAS